MVVPWTRPAGCSPLAAAKLRPDGVRLPKQTAAGRRGRGIRAADRLAGGLTRAWSAEALAVHGCSHGRRGMGGRLGQDSGSSPRTGGEAGWELAAAVDGLRSRVAIPTGELVAAVVAGGEPGASSDAAWLNRWKHAACSGRTQKSRARER
jgi:hypothetical protein